jgi:hypothetical protein
LSKPGWADLNSANLTPASGRRDHTILPSAATSLVSVLLIAHRSFDPPCNPVARKTLPRPPHPHPASVTIAIRPSCGVGWREFVEMICPTGEAKYFCKGDWTGKSEPRPTGKSVQSAGDAQRGPDEFRALQLRTREADYYSSRIRYRDHQTIVWCDPLFFP